MSAAQLKAQGNAHFAAKEWSKAVVSYTAALKAEQDTSLKAPLYSNRSAAFVHLDRLEEGEFRSFIDLCRITLGTNRAP